MSQIHNALLGVTLLALALALYIAALPVLGRIVAVIVDRVFVDGPSAFAAVGALVGAGVVTSVVLAIGPRLSGL